MKRLFWKAFYKIKLGEDYDSTLNSARFTWNSTKQVTKGDLSSFYDMDGNQIRGWHRPTNHKKGRDSKGSMQKYLDEYR